MKKLLVLLLAVIMVFSMVACGGGDSSSSDSSATDSSTTTNTDSGTSDTTDTTGGETSTVTVDKTFEQPVLICSAGQSADFEMVKVMFDRNGLNYESNILASKDDFGDCKTLLVVIGGSSKGLGAAGIDADAELERVKTLLDDAEAAGLHIVAAHIGGSGRRGQLGDRYIEPVVSRSEFCLVVAGGNDDGLFDDICTTNNIPKVEVAQMTDCIDIFAQLFPDDAQA